MKYLGIDFGSKRVGLAISDDEGHLAFPLVVVPNDPNLVESIEKIIKEKNITVVVLGESKNFKGEPNKIMAEIEKFKKLLEEKTDLPIFLEPEFLTSFQANQTSRELGGTQDSTDASAAAIILQSYLDRK